MRSRNKGKRKKKNKYLRRLMSLLLCLCVVLSLLGGTLSLAAGETEEVEPDNKQEQTSEVKIDDEIKARLLQQIKEGWDPYSADMTVEEFYALMEMFKEGTLPLEETDEVSVPVDISAYAMMGSDESSIDEQGVDKLSIDEQDIDVQSTDEPKTYAADTQDGIFIPRTMFMFGGLHDYDGLIEYNNENGNGDNYPPGLNPNGDDYKIPPESWSGVGVKTDPDTGGLRAAVIVNGINDTNPRIAGDVDQQLFPGYNGYYVRSVTAEGVEASILGVIRKSDGEYVYYYMSAKDQSTLVSSTTLPSGAKFIVNYRLNEHEITYKIEMSDGSSVPDYITPDSVFGAARPTKTVDAAYSFDVIAPYGYTVQVFRKSDENRIELTGQSTINNGYPLGTEPVYVMQNEKLVPDANNGPLTMTRNATFYNNLVTEDRTVVAVLTKRPDPLFNAFKLLPNTDNTKGRGTSALRYVHAKDKTTGEDLGMIPYDYEDVYLWANGGESKYDYYNDKSSLGGASFNNVKDGNISTADSWGWNSGGEDVTNDVKMTYDEETNSYSYQWTFQTNSGDNFLMDTLEINGVAISIPYFPKKSISNVADEIEGSEYGLNTWFRESTLPDGAVVRVEMLMSFTGNPQHVYRITITGAHSNVTLTNMNLMQYRSGAPEIAVYNLDGVHADTGDDTLQLLAIEYYSSGGTDNKAPSDTWCKGNLGDVLVAQPNYNGDTEKHNANIRFKLADGYGEPYYLFEKVRGGREVIKDQASATRQADGSIISKRAVQSLEGVEGPLDSKYIYGPDENGWYYIHLTEQNDKMALLSIVAVPVKYVVRYLPENLPEVTDEESPVPERAPTNMPEFEHNENCHPSFHADTDNGIPSEQYDDNWGNYYDMANNNIVAISSVTPQDPTSWYKFVDWVVVDANGEPVKKQTTSQVAVYQDIDDNTDESEGQEIHITSSHPLNINDVNEYSIDNEDLGGSDVSVHVIRLKATWERIKNPFKYSVVVDWVDSLGELHQEHFDGYWDDVLTESPGEDNSLTVFVNKDAEPLQRWLGEHPTYTFWDDVNNAVDDSSGTDEDKIKASMNILYPELAARVNSDDDDSLYNIVLRELLKMDISSGLSDSGSDVKPNGIDDFSRLSGYAFSVHENGGRIVIWMCEEKSGLEIRSDLQDDPLSDDEEFYYAINATAGPNNLPLEGIYKAYPEGYVGKDADGNDQRRIVDEETGEDRIMMDYDAWLVKFKNGKIANIIKNTPGATFPDNPVNPVTYFTIKGSKDDRINKGIILYAPIGNYTVAEVGCKSGGSYKLKLEYTNDPIFEDGMVEWDDNIPSNNQWLRGSEKRHITVNDPDYGKIRNGTLSQVTAGIKYNKGSNNMLYIMHFHNQTSSLNVGNIVRGASGSETAFDYTVKLHLPDNVKPLWKEGNNGTPGYYYFNYTKGMWDEDGNLFPTTTDQIVLTELENDTDDYNWKGTVKIASHEGISIITSVPEQAVSKQRALEESASANYSVQEGAIPKPYILEKITASSSKAGNDDAFTISKEDSKTTGMLTAVENHTITFYHDRDIMLPDAGAPGVMLVGLFGVPLIIVGLYLRLRKAV